MNKEITKKMCSAASLNHAEMAVITGGSTTPAQIGNGDIPELGPGDGND